MALAIATTASLPAALGDADWISMGGIPGTDNPDTGYDVLATAVDGVGNVYIGGNFTFVGGVIANHIAKWDGVSWSALGSGLNGTVYALAVSGSNVYVGGSFTNAGGIAAIGIAKWDGSGWSALGLGVGKTHIGLPYVYALAVSGNDVYAGGPFKVAGDRLANSIAKWDGSSWTALGSGLNQQVRALATSGGVVYAAGDFTTAGGNTANYIAKWDGNSWSALGSGMGGGTYVTPTSVYAVAVSGNNLYAGGNFTAAGGNAATNIAKWDGSKWSGLGLGLGGGASVFPEVAALAVSGSEVYAGGYFVLSGNSPAEHVAKWDGNSWSALGSGLGGGAPSTLANVSALAIADSNLYVGGNFTTAGGSVANNFAEWDGNTWAALSFGFGSSPTASFPQVSALAAAGSAVYAGGDFMLVGEAGNYVAKWNGSNWMALGQGMNERVYALTMLGSNLYAGGQFTTASNKDGVAVMANCVAKWNGNGWSTLGSGMWAQYGPPAVHALAVLGTSVYAGGGFSAAGSVSAKGIAKWNGSSWTNLAGGVNNGVLALAVSGTNLYAGGYFTSASNTNELPFTVNYIAKWNGSSWSPLGSGMNGYVRALAVSGGDLFAAGSFSSAGGIPANYIAKWDGSSWSALGAGLDGGYDPYSPPAVYALAVSGSNVYAAGNFTSAGGIAANYIAKWDGISWSPLGSGMGSGSNPYNVPPVVYALVISGNDLYAGGGFLTAGGKVSAYVAGALLDLPSLSIIASGRYVTLSWSSPLTGDFGLEETGTLVPPPSWAPSTANIRDDGVNKSITLPATNAAQFFRLRRQ